MKNGIQVNTQTKLRFLLRSCMVRVCTKLKQKNSINPTVASWGGGRTALLQKRESWQSSEWPSGQEGEKILNKKLYNSVNSG